MYIYLRNEDPRIRAVAFYLCDNRESKRRNVWRRIIIGHDMTWDGTAIKRHLHVFIWLGFCWLCSYGLRPAAAPSIRVCIQDRSFFMQRPLIGTRVVNSYCHVTFDIFQPRKLIPPGVTVRYTIAQRLDFYIIKGRESRSSLPKVRPLTLQKCNFIFISVCCPTGMRYPRKLSGNWLVAAV